MADRDKYPWPWTMTGVGPGDWAVSDANGKQLFSISYEEPEEPDEPFDVFSSEVEEGGLYETPGDLFPRVRRMPNSVPLLQQLMKLFTRGPEK